MNRTDFRGLPDSIPKTKPIGPAMWRSWRLIKFSISFSIDHLFPRAPMFRPEVTWSFTDAQITSGEVIAWFINQSLSKWMFFWTHWEGEYHRTVK
jgi:hypothetical protein